MCSRRGKGGRAQGHQATLGSDGGGGGVGVSASFPQRCCPLWSLLRPEGVWTRACAPLQLPSLGGRPRRLQSSSSNADQQCGHPSGASEKCRLLGPAPDPPSQSAFSPRPRGLPRRAMLPQHSEGPHTPTRLLTQPRNRFHRQKAPWHRPGRSRTQRRGSLPGPRHREGTTPEMLRL